MAHIQLRVQAGMDSPDDLKLMVQDKTYDYLLSSDSPTIRVSSFLEQDYPNVAASYAEVFVHPTCGFESKVERIIPGSKARTGIQLPCAMEEGEQITILLVRTPKAKAE